MIFQYSSCYKKSHTNHWVNFGLFFFLCLVFEWVEEQKQVITFEVKTLLLLQLCHQAPLISHLATGGHKISAARGAESMLTWNWKESLSVPRPKWRYQTVPSLTSCWVNDVVDVKPWSSASDGRQPSGGLSAGMDTNTTSPGQVAKRKVHIFTDRQCFEPVQLFLHLLRNPLV